MRIWALILAGLIAGSPAAGQKRIVTPSGDPEILLLGRSVGEANVQLAYVCERIGWKARRTPENRSLSCDVPGSDTQSVLIDPSAKALDLGNYIKVPIRRVVMFTISQSGGDALVRARAERWLPTPGSVMRYTRQPIADDSTFNGLLNIIALAGDASFTAGTRFAEIGYLGFRSDRFAEVEKDGRMRTAIQVGMVEPGSPAEAAGLKNGDFILAMNGRDFDDYREVSGFLSKLKPGAEVSMLVERGSERVELKTVATLPPAALP